MTEQAIQNKKGLSSEAVRLVEDHGFTEQFVRNTPKVALVELCKAKDSEKQAQEQAKQAKAKSTSRKPKQSALEKFKNRASGNMADGVALMLTEYQQGIPFDKSGMSTTHRYMARNYGVPVMAVLYEQDLLSSEAKAMIENYYKRQDS